MQKYKIQNTIRKQTVQMQPKRKLNVVRWDIFNTNSISTTRLQTAISSLIDRCLLLLFMKLVIECQDSQTAQKRREFDFSAIYVTQVFTYKQALACLLTYLLCRYSVVEKLKAAMLSTVIAMLKVTCCHANVAMLCRRRMHYWPSMRLRSPRKRWTWLIRWGTSSKTSSHSRWVLQEHLYVQCNRCVNNIVKVPLIWMVRL